MDLSGAMTAVEQAALGLALPQHRASSEATLLEFRRSPHALPACRHIREHSASAEAQFQAAATMRDAALREWTALPPAERSGLRQFCLHLVLTKSPPPPPVVASQLLSTLAVLLKRAWLDPDADRGAMLAEAEAAVAQASTTAARRTGLQLFTAVIAEFSPTTASPMNLPWDFHERCRASLETDFLRQFFSHGAGVARSVAESGAALAGADEGVCVAALRLMCTALAWDFSRGGNGAGAASGGFGFAGPGPGSARGGGDEDVAAKIAPGPAWREPLLAPGALDWLFTLHATTNARVRGESSGVGAVAATAAATRSALASLCAISGDVFPSGAEDPGETTRRAHFARCASALSGALRPAKEAVAWAARGAGEEALVDGARSLASLAATHPPTDFLAPLPPAPGADGGATGAQSQPPTLGILGELTLECLAAGSLTVEAEGTAAEDVTRMLMEAWSSLVERSAWRPGASLSPPGEGAVPPEITQGCAQVFQAYLQAGLAAAAAAAYDEDDGQEEEGQAGAAALDERLGLAAAVARAAPDATLPLLRAAAEAKKNALSAAAGAGRDPSVPLEELWWVSRLIPHVLADPFEGEIPLPPDAVAECSNRAALANAESPVDALSSEYIALACLCLDDAARRVVSPRLMETLCWGAARWADTYLMPEDTGGSVHAALLAGRTMGLGADDGGEGRVYRGSNKAKPASFSEAGGGVRATDALLRVALTALTAWPGEAGVQRVAAATLLPALTRRRALCRACVQLPSWGSILDVEARALAHAADPGGAAAAAAAGSVAGGVAFPPEIHRATCEAIGRAAEGVKDEAQCREYVSRALAPAGAALRAVANDAASMSHPGGEARAVATLEALRGTARATIARSQAPVFEFFQGAFDALLVVQRAGATSAQISRTVLKLTEELVAAQACFLPPSHAALLCRHCLRVVEAYKQSGRGSVGATEGGSVSLRAERVKEAYKEVKALLRMLTHVTNSDALDGNDEDGDGRGGGPAAAAAAAAAAGHGHEGRVVGGRAAGGAQEASAVDVAEVVFIGLNVVIPLITDELLTFPKLCHQYFSLLAHMLEAYPAKVAALPPDLFSTLMGTLEFGLKHADHEVGRESLGALGAMGAFHHAATAEAAEAAANPRVGNLASLAGPVGLGAHNAPSPERGGVGILAHLMRVVLNRLIFEDASMELSEAAADALLPLMTCERDAFRRTAEELLAGLSGNAGAQQHVAAALHELTTGNGLTNKVDRANRRRFRRNMGAFLTDTRSFVRRA